MKLHQTFARFFIVIFLLVGATQVPVQAQSAAQAQQSSATAPLLLFITQHCTALSKGGRCSLSFEQVRPGTKPSGTVQTACSAGWLAHVSAQRGTVESGGVNRGQAVVCGHPDPVSAIRAVLKACDEQTLGICQDANYVNIQWAQWMANDPKLQTLPMNEALPIERLPQAQRCESVVPLTESSQCPAPAAVLLRNAGLR